MAKALFWNVSDGEARKHRERRGLDTLLVYAVNDGSSVLARVRPDPVLYLTD